MAYNGIDWVGMLLDDIDSIENCMRRNMQSDIEAGYNPAGLAIRREIEELNDYIEYKNNTIIKIRDMDENKAQRWAYWELVRKGAITR